MVDAMILEMERKRDLYHGTDFNSLYIGGGTPSLLSGEQLEKLREAAYRCFQISGSVEFTVECNPDDLHTSYIRMLKSQGVNRLSIGIQSFLDRDLELMNRTHTARQAGLAIERVLEEGLENITIDLIYGIPGQSLSDWKRNLQAALRYNLPHISAYHLTFEPGTVFDHWWKKNRIRPLEEEKSEEMFRELRNTMLARNYLHYEISNFAQPGFESRHNMVYWTQENYAGIGPSAHSYDGITRSWNVNSNKKYIEYMNSGSSEVSEREELGMDDHYNEYIMTSLRTSMGFSRDQISERFGDNYVKYTLQKTQRYLVEGKMKESEGKIHLTEKGIFLADGIIEDFFRV